MPYITKLWGQLQHAVSTYVVILRLAKSLYYDSLYCNYIVTRYIATYQVITSWNIFCGYKYNQNKCSKLRVAVRFAAKL